MEQLTEDQKVLLNRLFDVIAHDDTLLEQLAFSAEIEIKDLEKLVNIVEF